SKSASTCTGESVSRAAVSGSFRPWPVMTQTTRVPRSRPAPASPAMPAAERAPRVEELAGGGGADGAARRAHRRLDVLGVRRLGDADGGADRAAPVGGGHRQDAGQPGAGL